METMKSEQIFKKLKTLKRTKGRLFVWVKNHKTGAWIAARKQIYKRAQEASKIARHHNWTKQFTPAERADIIKLFLHVREDVQGLFQGLDVILVGKKSQKKKATTRATNHHSAAKNDAQ